MTNHVAIHDEWIRQLTMHFHEVWITLSKEVYFMNFNPLVSEVTSIISEQSRSTILLTLLDGSKYTVSELALTTKITPLTESFHLSKMQDKGIIKSEKIGRHKYLSIATPEVASILKTFLTLTEERKPNSFREVSRL
jgi:DNA-binding transcriptional ArsR family regulator